MQHQPQTAPKRSSGTPKWAIAGLAFVGFVQFMGLCSALLFHLNGSSGIHLRLFTDGQLTGWPTTSAAAEQMDGLRFPVYVESINGRSLATVSNYSEPWKLLDRRVDAGVNAFVVRDQDGETRRLRLRVDYPEPRVVYSWHYRDLLYWLVSLLYLALGVFVWRKRPGDRTARALLLLALVGGLSGTLAVEGATFGLTVVYLRFALLTFWGPAACYFGLVFTQSDRKRWARWLVGSLTAAAALLGVGRLVALLLVWYRVDAGPRATPALMQLTSAMLIISVVSVVWTTWRASRPPHAPAVRRRARALAWSMLIAFALPSMAPLLWSHLSSWEARAGLILVQAFCLASFPLNMAFAILRLQMFDLRVVVRQGLVYVALSVLVSLGYLALVFFVFGLVGRHSQLPVALAGVIVLVLVLLFSVLKVRVQNAVDRLVFRSRYAYAGAISRASARLARAHTVEAVMATLEETLVQRMRLSRVFVALPAAGEVGALDVRVMASAIPPNAEVIPRALPQRMEIEAFAPVARAVRTHEPALVYDGQAMEATTDELNGSQGRSEGSFWSTYGIELVVPLVVGEEASELMGVLLVGPKRDGRAVDSGDRELLTTLGNQIAMALESAQAFDEIARLKEGLEQQVEQRTRELTEALRELQETQSQLIESQTLATLARVVAGVVHELNSPLGGLRSATDSLRRLTARLGRAVDTPSADDPRARAAVERTLGVSADLLEVMDGSSSRIQQVVSSLAQFVSLDEAPVKAIELRDGLEGALQLLKPQLAPGIEVERRYCSERVVVRANPARLNQVLFNLLENALKALEGAGRVEVRLDRRDRQAVVTISDDGRGIPPDQLSGLFEFGFGRKASGRVGLRTGLVHGKRVIEQLGGTIELASQPSEGTTVTVQLPAE